ncbi:MAG: 4Fe-4S dicluster domain-containing protein [Dehalococcoidia bacterium]|nr:4Fe-4S dicluster domain-containing protein [Dehalococcoidia bacterium]
MTEQDRGVQEEPQQFSGRVNVKAVREKLPKAIGHIERDSRTCSGCRTCEAVCSLSHEGVVSPALARTWIVDHILEGRRIDSHTCKQCVVPQCLLACPNKAIYVDPQTGARVVDANKCEGHRLCIQACPWYPNSHMKFDTGRNIAIKCDLCEGNPLCVKLCPEGALRFAKRGVK